MKQVTRPVLNELNVSLSAAGLAVGAASIYSFRTSGLI